MHGMIKPKIFVTDATFPEIIDYLSQWLEVEHNQADQSYTEPDLIKKLHDKAGVFAHSTRRFTAELFAACPHLKAVCNMAVGYNNIDVDAASAAGVMVTNTPDVLNETTADFGWALMMAAARRVTESEHFLRAGRWTRWRFDDFLGVDIHGSTLGIVGMGRIGQAIARRTTGFGMSVVYHNRTRLTPALEIAANNAQYLSLEECLRSADHLILTLPYSPQSHHLIGKAQLAMMKPTATLVNIARGGIVDDTALISALESGTIAAAGIDVFENEPLFNPAFLSLSNVVLTPHIGSASTSTRRAMAYCAADNLVAALTGKRPPNLLNPEYF